MRKQEGDQIQWDVSQKKKTRRNDRIRTSWIRKSILKGGNCCSKKVEGATVEGGKRERRKTEIVQELINEFALDILLKVIKLARSTYYYH